MQACRGTATMMGQQARSESLFYYFRLEDQIPKDHLLRVIDEQIDLSFVREWVKDLYSTTGRPSIDPEVLLRLLLVGYLYLINSEAVCWKKSGCIWPIDFGLARMDATSGPISETLTRLLQSGDSAQDPRG